MIFAIMVDVDEELIKECIIAGMKLVSDAEVSTSQIKDFVEGE